MMDEYEATAITTEGYGVFMNYADGPIPSQGLPSSQFCTDGIVTTINEIFAIQANQRSAGALACGNSRKNVRRRGRLRSRRREALAL